MRVRLRAALGRRGRAASRSPRSSFPRRRARQARIALHLRAPILRAPPPPPPHARPPPPASPISPPRTRRSGGREHRARTCRRACDRCRDAGAGP
ncbi:MAG: hypothetical protein DMF58_03500 [Acidobacteria bacterium]|nr:MAG: hypothetical protein DMF58_03500 [Acidobacteriota bacterium]